MLNKRLTKGDAVGPSRTANSSSVNGSLGMIIVRKGMSNNITIGKPIAAGKRQDERTTWQVNGKALHTNCLGDGHSNTKAKELHCHEKEDSATSDPSDRVFRCHHIAVADEMTDLCGNSVGFQGI